MICKERKEGRKKLINKENYRNTERKKERKKKQER